MNKIIFTDRKPANNNKYILIEGNNETHVTIEPDFEITEEGTPLNAETLNTAFAEKQDVLTVGEGISIENGKISASPDFSPFVENISAADYNADYKNWQAKARNVADIGYGIHYPVYTDCYYDSFSVEFTLEKMHFTASDTDPTAMVRWNSGPVRQFALIHFKRDRINVVSAAWKNLGAATPSVPRVAEGNNVRVRFIRMKNTDGTYNFVFFMNGNKVGEIKNVADINVGEIGFGTIGCKPEIIRDWKIRKLG